MKIHFISGLPRSGSTMLAAILRQNPRFFHFGMSSPVCDILMAVERASSRNNGMTVMLDDLQKCQLRLSVFESVYSKAEAGKRIAWDTNRMWCAKMPLLARLFPNCRVIACVRNLAWIMDSFERLFRASPLELSGLYDFTPAGTVYTRCHKLAAGDGVVGRALDALREAYYGEHSDRLLLIDYVKFCADPRGVMERVYQFIDEPVFLHNFETLGLTTYLLDNQTFDRSIGVPDLHKVRLKVERVSRETILPPGLFERYDRDDFWNHKRPACKEEVA